MAEWKRANTDWFHDARRGTFVHYLAAAPSSTEAPALTPDSWNRQIESFDVECYARTLVNIGCRYTLLTLGQNSGCYCSPNETHDRINSRGGVVSRDHPVSPDGSIPDALLRQLAGINADA